MRKLPLSTHEAAINVGFNYLVVLTADDLTQTSAGVAQTINTLPLAIGDIVRAVTTNIKKPFQVTSDASFNSLAFTVGDSGSATRYISSQESNANNNATFNDGVSNNTTTWTSASAVFVAGDVGQTFVSAGNVPAGTTIASRTNATTVVLSQAATTNLTSLTFTIGGRVATPVTTPEAQGPSSAVAPYSAADNLQVVWTPSPATKVLNAINVGELHVFVQLYRPSKLSLGKGPELILTK